jgi:hypothetical protein
MHKYLPSKKFLVTLASIILAVLIVVMVNLLANKKNIYSNSDSKILSASSSAKISEFMILDTDGDTLKDWEEALYKTDPKLADTDADGTNDNEELKINRDPLKENTALAGKEPNDKIDPQIIAEEQKKEADFNSLSTTDRVGRMMFSEYLATKKPGQELTEADISMIVQNTMSQIPAPSYTKYTLADLKISSSTDSETIKNYLNSSAKVFLDDKILMGKINDGNNDFYGFAQLTNLQTQISNNNTNITKTKEVTLALAEFNPIINEYTVLIDNLLKVTTPKNLADQHLDLINALKFIRDDLTQISKSNGDILALFPIINSQSANINNLWLTLSAIGDSLDLKMINNLKPDDYIIRLLNALIA